jgi:membrane fusion protein, multidrug efflux system
MARPRMNWISRLARSMREVAPYTAAALLLPGGSLIVLTLWTLHHRRWLRALIRPVIRRSTLGIGALFLSACAGNATPPPTPKPTVTVITLRASPVSLTTELPGRVSAYRIAEVRPQVNGVILRRLFTEGDRVRAGQQLYQIDPAPYQAALASAQALLAHARAAAAVAKLTEERYQSLVEARAVSREDYDNALAILQQDQADVASGEAAVRTAEINLAYTKVYSPITGRTGRSSVTEGALVTANQAASLVTVTQLDPVYVDVTEPSATILRFKRELASGNIVSLGANKTAAHLLLEDGTRYDPAGALEFSEVTVDEGTGSVTLRAIFPNPNDLLLPGMFVHATIEEGVREGAILASQRGITHAPDGSATALVVGADDTVERRIVELERAIGDEWVVSRGLAAGDRLIVGGVQRIQPGMQVTVRDSAPTHSLASESNGHALALIAR